jgi:hypothetical protein
MAPATSTATTPPTAMIRVPEMYAVSAAVCEVHIHAPTMTQSSHLLLQRQLKADLHDNAEFCHAGYYCISGGCCPNGDSLAQCGASSTVATYGGTVVASSSASSAAPTSGSSPATTTSSATSSATGPSSPASSSSVMPATSDARKISPTVISMAAVGIGIWLGLL